MATYNAAYDQPTITWSVTPAAQFLLPQIEFAFGVFDPWIEPDFVQVASGGDILISYEQISLDYGAYAWTYWDENRDITNSTIQVNSAYPNQDFYRVMAHEVGHAVGLDHDADPASLMFAGPWPPLTLASVNINDLGTLYAPDSGDNALIGAPGNDLINAGAGRDTVTAGQGNDSVFGQQGDDVLYGNQGTDYLHGGQGADTIYGGQGNDTLAGGVGDDLLFGGVGSDLFVFAAAGGADRVADYSPADGDTLDFQGQSYTSYATAEGLQVTLSGGGSVLLVGFSEALSA